MLPNINTDNRRVGQERILVGRGYNLELLSLGVVSEPAPAGALNGSGGVVHFGLES